MLIKCTFNYHVLDGAKLLYSKNFPLNLLVMSMKLLSKMVKEDVCSFVCVCLS